MLVTIELHLAEQDSPMFCSRVNDCLHKLLSDHHFVGGSMKSGEERFYTFDDCLTKVVITFEQPS